MAKRKSVKPISKRDLALSTFDPAEYLNDEPVIAEYLALAARDPNPDRFIEALGNVARAKGMSAIAEKAGVSRESLYKSLAPGAAPRFETVRKLLDAVGMKLDIVAPA